MEKLLYDFEKKKNSLYELIDQARELFIN